MKDSLGGLLPRIPLLQALQDLPQGTEIFVDYGSSTPFTARAAAQQYHVDVADVHRLLRAGEVAPGNVRVSLHLMAGDRPIHLSGGLIILPSRHNGLHAFRMWQSDACKAILAVLEHNYLNPAEHGARCVGLLASLNDPDYNGYTGYHLTQAVRHLSADQQRRTAVVRTQASMWKLLNDVTCGPSLKLILSRVLQELGLDPYDFDCCKDIHFVAQDQGAQARFSWHADNNARPGLTLGVITAIVQLSNTCSAMQMFGFENQFNCEFLGAGYGAIFHGGAIHRSCMVQSSSNQVTYKVVFFLQ